MQKRVYSRILVLGRVDFIVPFESAETRDQNGTLFAIGRGTDLCDKRSQTTTPNQNQALSLAGSKWQKTHQTVCRHPLLTTTPHDHVSRRFWRLFSICQDSHSMRDLHYLLLGNVDQHAKTETLMRLITRVKNGPIRTYDIIVDSLFAGVFLLFAIPPTIVAP